MSEASAQHQEPQSIELEMQTRAASFRNESLNEEKRTVEVVFSSGAAVRRFDWESFRFINEKLDMQPSAVRSERLKSGSMPLLNQHNSFDLGGVLGVVESGDVDGSEGRAVIRFASTPDVETVWQKVRDGIIRNISVGYLVYQYRDVTEKDDKTPTLLAIDWEPVEISAVAVGADAKAGFRSQPWTSRCLIQRAQPEVAIPDAPQLSLAAQDGPQTDPHAVRLWFELASIISL